MESVRRSEFETAYRLLEGQRMAKNMHESVVDVRLGPRACNAHLVDDEIRDVVSRGNRV